jgi:cytochrome c biogenesis protein CcmG/thiol:disulfide interchange protein DsbE
MKNKFFSTFIIIIFIVIFLIFYKGLQNSNIYTPKTIIKKNIPIFKAKLFDSSNIIKSEDIFNKNNFYLFNVWASWCIPCKDEHPFLMKLSKNKNIEIIGLNYKDSVLNAKNFLDKYKNPYETIIQDSDGTIGIEWGAYGVPETFIISKDKIIKRIIGPINEESFLEIKEIIE